MRPNVSELAEKINRLVGNGNIEVLSALERDLLKQYLRDLYTLVDEKVPVVVKPAKIEVPEAKEEVKTEEPAKESIQPESLLIQMHPHKEEPILLNDLPAAEEEKPVVKAVKETGKSSLNESVKGSGGLNEKHKAETHEVHKKLGHKPMKDLIDLNKRFVMVNELFRGDGEAFTTAIGNIDRVEDYAAAEEYIQAELMPKYKWDENAQSTRLFLKLTKQRFGLA